jgi:hypothetical protein
LSGYTAAFQVKKNSAEQWRDKQRVKAPLGEDKGMVWTRGQPKTTSNGVKAVKKGRQNSK